MGSGHWGAFREAVAELADPDDPEMPVLAQKLRIALSDLGHVDFFVDGPRRWQVLRPALVGLAGSNAHLFVGGRTRHLAEKLTSSLLEGGASVSITKINPGLARICLEGPQEILRATAKDLGLEYVPVASALLASRLLPLRHTIEWAPARPEPINWAVRSWSFESKAWIHGRFARTALEYTNRHGASRYMIDLGHAGLRDFNKRVSIYGAAFLKGRRIIRYCFERERLLVPRWAPLPEPYSRVACLAGGQLATVQEDDLVFESVTPNIASMLLIALGQGYPKHGDVL